MAKEPSSSKKRKVKNYSIFYDDEMQIRLKFWHFCERGNFDFRNFVDDVNDVLLPDSYETSSIS